MAMPRPVPGTRLVVELTSRLNGSKTWSTNSGAMPMPLSVTTKRRCTAPGVVLGSCWISKQTRPPSGVYLTALPSRLSSTWFSRRRSATTVSVRRPRVRITKVWFLAWACGARIVERSSASDATSTSERLSEAAPLSIFDMSSTSLMRDSRCWLDALIWRVWSSTASLSPPSRSRRRVRPITAFIGVRMSWLMLERNVLFEALAASAASRALLSTASLRCSKVRSERTTMARSSPPTSVR